MFWGFFKKKFLIFHVFANFQVLVFSQFQSTLNWLKDKLKENSFDFRTLEGHMTRPQRTKALEDFQNDPPTTIFLLSVRAGAVGINLTQVHKKKRRKKRKRKKERKKKKKERKKD